MHLFFYTIWLQKYNFIISYLTAKGEKCYANALLLYMRQFDLEYRSFCIHKSLVPHGKLLQKLTPESLAHSLGLNLSIEQESGKPQLFLSAGLYRPLFHHVLRHNLPTEQQRVRIVCLRIACNSFQTVRSITILASVATGVVHTNVDACHAAAFRALVFVLFQRQTATGNLLQQGAVNAVAVGNAVWFKVDLFCAGFQHKVMFTRYIGQALGKFDDFFSASGAKPRPFMLV